MNKQEKNLVFIQQNSFDGGFLQSEKWLGFQGRVGRKIIPFSRENLVANIVEHVLPIVGKYFYIPRGPIVENGTWNIEQKKSIAAIVKKAKENNAGWVRIDPGNHEMLEHIKENVSEKIVKAPHDMQPREIFVIDIAGPESEILSQMKAKTRYNIRLAQKHGVKVEKISDFKKPEAQKYINNFLQLTKEMAERQGIATHPEIYYRKMLESLSENIVLYIAEYQEKIIAANLVLFYGKFATYLHGASSNDNRNVMAPFLLQWQAILDAKERECEKYDFGGVKITNRGSNNWAGITNFKLGFSQNTKAIVFPGSYDIVINSRKYAIYRGLQKAKSFAVKFRK